MAVGSTVLHTAFLRHDRLKLIDRELRDMAEALIDTKIKDLRRIDFAESEKIVSEELGKENIGKFFVIRDDHDDIVYESPSAQKVAKKYTLPIEPTWVELKTRDKYIRLLNLRLPKIPDRNVQIGLILNPQFVLPPYFSATAIPFLSAIFILGLLASFFLTSFLLDPLAKLEKFLNQISEQAKVRPQLMNVPESIFGRFSYEDEFQKMVRCLNVLIERVNSNYRFSRLWAYQMAHELKTPLSILALELERLQHRKGLSVHDLSSLQRENGRISETINTFLGWAELESSDRRGHLYVNRVHQVVRTIANTFQDSFPDRIRVEIDEDAVVFATPQHLEQAISNLLTNALNYSDALVVIRVKADRVSVSDQGQGIPAKVIERMGEPFNRGNSEVKGHGLGLAWINSICRFYSWKLVIESSDSGSVVTITFPDSSQSLDEQDAH